MTPDTRNAPPAPDAALLELANRIDLMRRDGSVSSLKLAVLELDIRDLARRLAASAPVEHTCDFKDGLDDCAACKSPAGAVEDAVSADDAREALDSMDDFARMDVGVDAHGPRGVLERYITQQAALATPAARQGGEALHQWRPKDTDGWYDACRDKYTEMLADPNVECRTLCAALSARPAAGDGGAAAWALVGFGATLRLSSDKSDCDAERDNYYRNDAGVRVRPLVFGDTAPPAREGVPEGMVMLPRTMSCDMYAAGIRIRNLGGNVSDIYNAIVAAAPTAGEGPKDG